MKRTMVKSGQLADPDNWDPPGKPVGTDDLTIPGTLIVNGNEPLRAVLDVDPRLE